MPQLHIRREGRTAGPFSPDAVKEMIHDGTVVATDSLRIDGDSDWIDLADIPALSKALARRAATPQLPPKKRKRAATSSRPEVNSTSSEWDKLVALESHSAAAPPELTPPSLPAHLEDESDGSARGWRANAAADIAGGEWGPARLSLDVMFVVAICRTCIVAAGAGVVIMKHLSQLAELGFSVFIPTAAGNTHIFENNELIHIGFALTVVTATLGVLLFLSFSRAYEVFVFVAGGLAMGVALTGMMSAGDSSSDTIILKVFSVVSIVAAFSMAMCSVPLLWTPLPISAKCTLVGAVAAGLASCGVAFKGLTSTIDVDFHMSKPEVHFPSVPPMAVAYGLVLLLETGLSAWVLRTLGAKFGDSKEDEAIDFYLFAHVSFAALMFGSVFLINRGIVSMFTGVVIGCVATMIAAVDLIWHNTTILHTRNTLR